MSPRLEALLKGASSVQFLDFVSSYDRLTGALMAAAGRRMARQPELSLREAVDQEFFDRRLGQWSFFGVCVSLMTLLLVLVAQDAPAWALWSVATAYGFVWIATVVAGICLRDSERN